MRKPNIVILGAGYGGLMTTIQLQKSLSEKDANITLVNMHNYHYQSTWLHEAAAGTINHNNVRIMIQNVINPKRVNFIVDKVVSVDPEEKIVKLKEAQIEYDILVIGLGFEEAAVGIPGLAEHAFMIKNLDSSMLIREHLEYNFALYNNEKEKNQSRLNIVVGGGEFTSVEFLGELANRIPQLCEDYDISKARVRIINIESEKTILSGLDQQLIDYAMNSLESRGIEIVTGASLKECKPDSVIYEKNGKEVEIPTMTTVWAAGGRANSVVEISGFETNQGKIEVRDDMRTPDYDDVFVVGDCALMKDVKTRKPFSGHAQIIIQQSEIVARNIKKLVNGKTELDKLKPNRFDTVVSLGYNDAIGTIMHNCKLYGWKATVMKKLLDNRYLMKIGGLGLVLKKGKFNVFY